MKDLLDLIRGITRPVITLLLVSTLCVVVLRIVRVSSIPGLSPDVWLVLIASFTTGVATAVGYWFGSRGQSPR